MDADHVSVTWPVPGPFVANTFNGIDGAVVSGLTICVNGLLVLFSQLFVPVKAAVTEWLPTVSALVVVAAWPVPSTGTVAKVFAPSLNVTVPVGTPPLPVTVAVNVTFCPITEGFKLDATVVEVGELTTWFWPLPPLLPHPLVPVNTAEIVCDPRASDDVVVDACPLPSTGMDAPDDPSIVKTTLPVGVPAPASAAVTVAVIVTN